MTSSTFRPRSRHTRLRATLQVGMLAFMATLLGAPVQAGVNDFPIPANPLSVGLPPAPNVMLLIDNVGRMGDYYQLPTKTADQIKYFETPRDAQLKTIRVPRRYYLNGQYTASSFLLFPTVNSLAYDPRVDYKPWKQHDGQYYPDMDPALTALDPYLAVQTSDAAANAQWQSQRVSLYDLSASPVASQAGINKTWFYVPRHGITNGADLTQYTVYKLVSATQAEQCKTVKQDAQGRWVDPPVGLPAGEQPWPSQDCVPVSRFTWTTPQGQTITRSLAEEWRNYANWAGYHRTVIKMLKARLSYLLAELDDNHRLGYMTIGPSNQDLEIPVQTQGGLFTGGNRQQLFDRMLGTQESWGNSVNNSHRGVVRRAGEYFKRKDKNGPWGPEVGDNQLACRQNFALLATGSGWTGEWGGANPINVGNQDGTPGDVMTAPDGSTYQYQPTLPYQDGYADTLADVAMKYWKEDLRPDLDNIVPSTAENPAFWQHMVTMAVGIGLQGKLDPVQDLPDLTAGNKSWPNVHYQASLEDKADDLFHATLNSRGTYTITTTPDELTLSVAAALGAIRQRAGSAANLGFNGITLKAGGYSYVPSYVSGKWTGELTAYPVTATGIGTTPLWQASSKIPLFTTNTRRLLTHGNPGQSGAVQMKPFPTPDQQTALGTDVADWIRGDRSREGTSLRTREHLLGDIVHSSPQYVRTPNAHAVLVGANDGMLHLFDADSGRERFAYLPGLLDLDELKQNSRKDGFTHQYFVDGQIAARPTGNGNDVMAVAGLGRGGRGVFGVQFNLAGSFNPSAQLTSWEYPGDNDMGRVLGQPQLHKVRGHIRTDGNQLSVLVPNGINSPSGKAAIYILNADTGAVQQKIVLGDDVGNGLINLTAVSMLGDGVVDVIYAGDMRGNVWRLFDFGGNGGWSAIRVFNATDKMGKRQPITGSIHVVLPQGREGAGEGAWPYLLFGTGSYLTAADQKDKSTQSWYGFIDKHTSSNNVHANAITRASLSQRRFISQQTAAGKMVRTIETVAEWDYGRTAKSWVLDLVPPNGQGEGERMIGEQLILNGTTLVASSMIPTSNGCGGEGQGFLNVIDLHSGNPVDLMFDFNGDGKVDDNDKVDGKPISSIDLGVGAISNPGLLLGQLSGANTNQPSMLCVNSATGVATCLGVASAWGSQYGRVNWREIRME